MWWYMREKERRRERKKKIHKIMQINFLRKMLALKELRLRLRLDSIIFFIKYISRCKLFISICLHFRDDAPRFERWFDCRFN